MIEHPLFQMRAKVAAHVGGHAFEQRFLNLDMAQLFVLFEQAKKEEKKEHDRKMEFTKNLNDIWFNNFNEWFKTISFYSNPEVYNKVQEMKDQVSEIESSRIDESNFEEMWQTILQEIPSEVRVEFADEKHSPIQEVTGELKDVVVGWVPFNKRIKGV